MSDARSIKGRRVTGVAALPIVALVFLLLGLTGLVVSAIAYATESRSARSASATGTIVNAGYRPLVQFKAADGSVVQFLSPVRNSFLKTGDAVAVAFNPADPRDAAVDSISGRWLFTALFGGLGCLFFVIGIGLGVLWRILRRRLSTP